MKKSILICVFLLLCLVNLKAQSIQEARKLTDNEQYENASSMYQVLLSTNPNDAMLFYFYAENLLLSDNPDSARIIFEKGRAINPNQPLIKIGEAKILMEILSLKEAKMASELDAANPELKARYEQAKTNIQTAGTLIDQAIAETKDINILNEATEAMIRYRNKDTDKAKTILDKANKIDPKNIKTLLLYGDLYTELNNGTLAADYYNRALDQDKSSARAIVSKGRLYKRSTNYEGAAAEFENAISIEPSYAPAHRELGETYIKLGKLDQAKAEYKKYLELSKNNCSARIRYATFLYVSKNYNDALTELNLVKQRCDSNHRIMLRILTYCYYETKDFENGLNTINHLFRILTPDKRISKDWEYYGKLLIATDQDSLGIEQLQKAFELEPSRVDLLSEMSNAWLNLKQYPNAIQIMKQKIDLGKDVKVQDHLTLGKAYYFNKQFTAADSASMKATELNPKWSTAWLYRAKSNAQIDSTTEAGLAKPYYEKYIETAMVDSMKPDFGARYNNGLMEAYGYLAYYYLLKKDLIKSGECLRKQLEYTTDSEEKKRILKGIDQLKGGPKNGKTK